MEGSRVRASCVWLVGLGVILAIGALAVPGASASKPPTWQLAIAARCSGGDVCGGFTVLNGHCVFVGASSGTEASCESLLTGTIGTVRESISGTAWDIEPGLLTPVTGVGEFFITDGEATYAGPAIVAALHGGFNLPGCTTTGATLTCPIPVVEDAGLYSPDALDPVIPGLYTSNVCFASGLVDPSCSFIQQLTLIG